MKVQRHSRSTRNFLRMVRYGGRTAVLMRRDAVCASCMTLVATMLLSMSACDRSTSHLSAEQERRFQSEGIRRKADDINFRFTRDPGGRSERWEDRRASIIVTDSSLLIHKNAKVGLEVTPRARREILVQRSQGRIRIRTGRGRSEEIWSFEPQSDAEGWMRDIRAVVQKR